jgi:hypothetical protein
VSTPATTSAPMSAATPATTPATSPPPTMQHPPTTRGGGMGPGY